MQPQDREALLAELRAGEETAARDVPILRRNLERLVFAAEGFIGDFSVDANQPLDFMAVHFHDKQVRHAGAILTLDTHLDTALIARSMMEGLCFLKWAAKDPTRSLRWRVYAFIDEWRRLREDSEAHGADAAARFASLRAHLDEFGDALYGRTARAAVATGRPLPDDPFIRTWHDARLEDVFASVSGQGLYDGPYAFSADWHHWSPTGLQVGMNYEQQTLTRLDHSAVVQATSLATAFQCLIETTAFVVQHFGLPVEGVVLGALKAYQVEVDLVRAASSAP